ncbi:MAG: type VI secretion system protein TssA [Gammaproteobacteria bacterium]
MSSFSVDELLADVAGDDPCGPDMEYDPLFQQMERAAEGKRGQQAVEGETESEPPDWRELKKTSLEILGQSKDLRAAVSLAHGALRLDGWSGFADALKLIEGLIAQHWSGVHPALDPDDDNDPVMRVNALNALSLVDNRIPEERRVTIMESCLDVSLVEAKGVGAFGFRDMLIANGELPAPENPDGEIPSTAIIEAACMQTELEDLQAVAENVAAANTAIAGISSAIAEHIPLTETPDLVPLSKVLTQILVEVNAALQKRGVSVDGAGDEDGEAGAQGEAKQAGISGTVQNREDVIRVLDQVCEFYRRSEPSSPVPILLQRARSLVNMDFMDIVRNLTPNGVGEIENLRGPEES